MYVKKIEGVFFKQFCFEMVNVQKYFQFI